MTHSSLATDAVATISIEIEANGPNGDLKGSLMLPPGSTDVALIIPGSGPINRDGNSILGIRAQPYRLLAEGLAQERIASVRTDKRGMFGSRQAIANPNEVKLDDYVQDTRNWVSAIHQRTSSQRIWLIGHSEGGLIALATLATHIPFICGLVLIATPGHPLGDVFKRQIASNAANAPIVDAAIEAIDMLEAGQNIRLQALPPSLQKLFHPEVQDFLISLFAVDPAKLIEKIQVPVLIVQGERDLQVEMADAERLKQHHPSASLAVFPNANHLMKPVAIDDRAANLATYSDPDLPLVPDFVRTISQFISNRL